MRYDTARTQHPLILLDYFLSRASKIYDESDCAKPPPSSFINESLIQKPIEADDQCNSNKATGILDYDAVVPVDLTIAYPVYFKFREQKQKPGKKRRKAK